MKKTILILIAISILPTKSINAQGNGELPHSTLHIVRSGALVGGGCFVDVSVSNQKTYNLDAGSIIDYKIYSEGEITVNLDESCAGESLSPEMARAFPDLPKSVPPTKQSFQLTLDVKRGNDYYVLYDFQKFTIEDKATIDHVINLEPYHNRKFGTADSRVTKSTKQEENLDYPINKDSFKDSKQEGKGQGTCFLISGNGYFVTNNHVVENAKEIIIKGVNGDFTTKYAVTVVATDKANDLALLKISNTNLKFNIPPFAIRSNGVEQGEKIFAMGYPLTDAMGNEIKLTDGIINAKSGIMGDISKFQVSSAVQPGNSGCPLFDEKGNVIGVINSKLTIADATYYAIKATYLESFLKNIEGFKYPTLANTIKEKSMVAKVAELKKCIYIVETN